MRDFGDLWKSKTHKMASKRSFSTKSRPPRPSKKRYNFTFGEEWDPQTKRGQVARHHHGQGIRHVQLVWRRTTEYEGFNRSRPSIEISLSLPYFWTTWFTFWDIRTWTNESSTRLVETATLFRHACGPLGLRPLLTPTVSPAYFSYYLFLF